MLALGSENFTCFSFKCCVCFQRILFVFTFQMHSMYLTSFLVLHGYNPCPSTHACILATASLQESQLMLVLSLRFCTCYSARITFPLLNSMAYYLWSFNVPSQNCKHTCIPTAVSLLFTGLLLSKDISSSFVLYT